MRLYDVALLVVGLSHPAWGQIVVDHRHVDQAESLPQPVVEAIGKQKWFFLHASLGMNCILRKGIDGLHQGDPARYPLRSQPVDPAFGREPQSPRAPTVAGTVYHWPRGQTDAAGKMGLLNRAVRDKGWRSPAVDIVFDKYCFIDFAANAETYLQGLAALEKEYPDTLFIYATMPLLRTDREDRPQFLDANAQTNRYNKSVREHCSKHGKVLFDIADIEAHDPEGREHTYPHDGQPYQTLFAGYAQGNSNYLNALGSRRVALGWYALAAAIASKSSPVGERASGPPPPAARPPSPPAEKDPAPAPPRRSPPPQGKSPTGLTPLCEMDSDDRYKGEDGGLYGEGRNEPPAAHAEAARRELAKIRPLDANGNPSPDGKIVLLSLGMSNTSQEFRSFKEMADRDPAKAPHVTVVNGAFGGMDVVAWAENRAGQWGTPWEGAGRQLERAGVTAPQVQALWLKQAKMGPAQWGEFPAHARKMADGIATILNMCKERYPNLRIAYLSSRIYAGYATIPLNPEPYAYESAFSVRWLIQEQIKGDPKLNYDPARGPVRSPLLLWGPYLWADGTTPRKGDGLVWNRDDLARDGTHPSAESGMAKAGRLLLAFFQTDPFARAWYCGSEMPK